MWDLARLGAAFRQVGIVEGDSVIVHSSFRSLAPVEGGADVVLDALLESVGPGGNLMLPTFNYSCPLPEPCYDPALTPCRTGIISELGCNRPGTVRSLHPTHSVAVIGPDADALTRDHLEFRAFGIGSPIDRLAQSGGKVLLIGVGHTSNSMIHVAEESTRVPKPLRCDSMPFVRVRTPDGGLVSHQLDTSPSCSAGFGAAEYALRKHAEISDARAGAALMQLMRGTDIIKRVREMIDERPDVLLCTRSECRSCTGKRRALREQGHV